MKTISLGRAWAHCMGTASYWEWLIAVIVIGVAGIIGISAYAKKKNTDLTNYLLWFCVVFVFAFAMALLMRPVQVSTTPVEWADKGEYIGY